MRASRARSTASPPSATAAAPSSGSRAVSVARVRALCAARASARRCDGLCSLTGHPNPALVHLLAWLFVVKLIDRLSSSSCSLASAENARPRRSPGRSRAGASSQFDRLSFPYLPAVTGQIDMVRDLLKSPTSLLFLGRPGVGKTTVIRELARVLSEELKKRVVIVDTSNEIGGDGDIPHPAIGTARRMQVPDVAQQHRLMIEAVENHMPEVVIVDEIGTEEEALACRTIAERGVMLIGTAHGQLLENLLKNPTLSDLVGGISSVTLSGEWRRWALATRHWKWRGGTVRLLSWVYRPRQGLLYVYPSDFVLRLVSPLFVRCLFHTLLSRRLRFMHFFSFAVPFIRLTHMCPSDARPPSLTSPVMPCAADEEARARGTQKSVLERTGPPTFPLVIEMRERDHWVTHWVEDSVDSLLHGKCPVVQVRSRDPVTGKAVCTETRYDVGSDSACYDDVATFGEYDEARGGYSVSLPGDQGNPVDLTWYSPGGARMDATRRTAGMSDQDALHVSLRRGLALRRSCCLGYLPAADLGGRVCVSGWCDEQGLG